MDAFGEPVNPCMVALQSRGFKANVAVVDSEGARLTIEHISPEGAVALDHNGKKRKVSYAEFNSSYEIAGADDGPTWVSNADSQLPSDCQVYLELLGRNIATLALQALAETHPLAENAEDSGETINGFCWTQLQAKAAQAGA